MAILQDHPNGKMTLTRGYEYPLAAGRSPFALYEPHERRLRRWYFFCLRECVYFLGTTPDNVFEVRGSTLTVDVIAAELYQNTKQRKEHLSSLSNRQDRFRPFCVDGSSRMARDMRVRTLRNVCHLHSVFAGELMPDVTMFDLMGSIFPLLGAQPWHLLPIANAEEAPHRYYGSVVEQVHRGTGGCFLNIRNARLHDGTMHAKVGIGVLKESDPDAPLSITLTAADCDDVVAAITKVCAAWR